MVLGKQILRHCSHWRPFEVVIVFKDTHAVVLLELGRDVQRRVIDVVALVRVEVQLFVFHYCGLGVAEKVQLSYLEFFHLKILASLLILCPELLHLLNEFLVQLVFGNDLLLEGGMPLLKL